MSDMPPPPPFRPRSSSSCHVSYPVTMQSTTAATPPKTLPPPRRASTARDPPHLNSTIVQSAPRPTITRAAPSISSYLGATSGFASRARSAIASAGSYVANTASQVAAAAAAGPSSERRAAWEDWARDWREGKRAAVKGNETIHVLPGWAVKIPRQGSAVDAFDLKVSTLGFCTFVRDPRSTSRTQKALMGIAKRFAALPPLPNVLDDALTASPKEELQSFDLSSSSDKGSDLSNPLPSLPSTRSPGQSRESTTDLAFLDPTQLTLAHEYLDSRLRPFWSNVLAYRRVTLSIYTVPLSLGSPAPSPDEQIFATEPLLRTTFTTNAQGHFAHSFVIPWERICTHPPSTPMAFAADRDSTSAVQDWGLLVRAELLTEDSSNRQQSTSSTSEQINHEDDIKENIDSTEDSGNDDRGITGLGKTSVETTAVVKISKPGGVRVISDLDDTVKHSDILSGPREVFRNVFCRRLEDICVPGMNNLYNDLNSIGLAGLHFVSNSPFELYPIVAEFLRVHKFPTYFSLKLKFYGGRSIVTSLFEPAGERKRPSIVEIMDSFADSRFILFGDSGEQDLELYTAIARERPHQVVAIFIRDVTSGRADDFRRVANVSDSRTTNTSPKLAKLTLSAESDVDSGYYSPAASTPASGTETPTNQSNASPNTDEIGRAFADLQELTAAQQKVLRRAALWEGRAARAVRDIPQGVQLVFFKNAEEVESLAKELVVRNIEM